MTAGLGCQQRPAGHCMGTTTGGFGEPPPFIHPFPITASPALVDVLEPGWLDPANLAWQLKLDFGAVL